MRALLALAEYGGWYVMSKLAIDRYWQLACWAQAQQKA